MQNVSCVFFFFPNLFQKSSYQLFRESAKQGDIFKQEESNLTLLFIGW